MNTPFQNPRNTLMIDKRQYALLVRCSVMRDVAEWNAYRHRNPGDPVLLEGADLRGMNLQRADLRDACLTNANLEGADLYRARLESAWLQTARVDSRTSLWKVAVNKAGRKHNATNVRGVPLDGVKIDAGTKQLLEYNTRRSNWEEWYRAGGVWSRFLRQSVVRLFWATSDYGRSTTNLLSSFCVTALAFSLLYVVVPGVLTIACQAVGVNLAQSLYFSIVTMTTLGFGDIHANVTSPVAMAVVATQVITGYWLLGALITRLNILFTTGGPAARFSRYAGPHYDLDRASLTDGDRYFTHNGMDFAPATELRRHVEAAADRLRRPAQSVRPERAGRAEREPAPASGSLATALVLAAVAASIAWWSRSRG
jgi:hypothetical protein